MAKSIRVIGKFKNRIINKNNKESIDSRILKLAGQGTFLEISDAMLYEEDPKFIFRFTKYDSESKQGAKYTDDISIFMEVDKADALASMILSGAFARMKLQAQKTGNNQLYDAKGGTSKASLAKQNRPRKDGNDESRQFIIEAGMKTAFAMKALSGPGQQDEQGLFCPLYKQQDAEQTVIIGLSEEAFHSFARAIQRKVNALDILEESKYQKDRYEYFTKKKQEIQNSNK